MSTTPHRSPEPWDDAFGILASDDDTDVESSDTASADPDSDEGTEWGAADSFGYQTDVPWQAEPAADEQWYDEDALIAGPSEATLYSSGPGLPARGVLIATGASTAGCALLDLALTGGIGFFFELCFVVICLVAAMAASPRALFTVGVMPPLVFAGLVAVVALVSPETIGTGGLTAVFLTGLADHALPLCIAYGVALTIASARGLASRSSSRR